MSLRTKILASLAILAACYVGYAFYQQQTLQARLDQQLEELNWTLAAQNESNKKEGMDRLKGIEASVIKNRNHPNDLPILREAEYLRTQTNALLDTLQARREALLRLTGNRPGAAKLRRYAEANKVTHYLGSGTPAARQLQKQLAQYVAHSRYPYFQDSAQLTLPPFDNMTVIVALTALTELETDILAREMRIQQAMAPRVGGEIIRSSLQIMATAESNTVAPGEEYRADFFVMKVLASKKAEMYRNGRRVPVDADGIGHVSFRVPTRPGPASWQATVRLRLHGVDRTFRLRVPYQIARH